MTILIIGLGSMGQRRIRLLKKYDCSFRIIGVDSCIDRCKKSEEEYGVHTYSSLQEVVEKEYVECAFVSTSPLSHAELICQCLKNNMHVFTELNLVDTGYDENIKLAKDRGKVLFLSSTFLYRNEIMYISNKVKSSSKKVNYMYHAGQYLPDWHPWENYKDFFVGQKKTNGCREFMAIEFPWITNVFGNIKSVKTVCDKMSNLELDYPDNYILMVEHENGNKGAITLDIVSRKASRNLEVFGENIYFTWNGTPEGLIWYDIEQKTDVNIHLYDTVDKRSDYASSIIEDAYYSEICNFFQTIAGIEKPKYTFQKDKKILKLIENIENLEDEKDE